MIGATRWASLVLLAGVLVLPTAAQSQATVPDRAPRLPRSISVRVVTPEGALYTGARRVVLVGDEARTPQEGPDGSLVFRLRPGPQSLRLIELDAGCEAVGSNPRDVTGESGSVTAEFVVNCEQPPVGNGDDVPRRPVVEPPPPPPPPVPTADVTPKNSTIRLGQPIELTFSVEGVWSAVVKAEERSLHTFGPPGGEARSDDAGARSFETKLVVTPTHTTTYELTGTGPGGQVEAVGTVNVLPSVQISFDTIEPGARGVIRMIGDNATEVELRSESGEFVRKWTPEAATGFEHVAEIPLPNSSAYVVTVSGPGGVDRETIKVAVGVDTIPVPTRAPVSFTFGLSGVGLVAGAAAFAVPTLSAGAAWGNWLVELRGGLRPKGSSGPDPISPFDPRPQFGDRTDKLLSASLAYFPETWRDGDTSFGAALSYFAGWEMVRDLDYFMTRAHGPAVGPRLRIRNGRWNLIGGVDLQYAHVEEFDDPVARWEFGVTPSFTFTYVFDRGES